jgi:tRNA (guanine37-N1)-methyltransferase
MKIHIITLFPDMFAGPFDMSMLKKAQDKDLLDISFVDLRKFGIGPRRQVDDTPYGGGDGMVLKPEPVVDAIESIKKACKKSRCTVILLTPQGDTFNQEKARDFAKLEHIILVCGHYEGFDERIRDFVDIEISIGNYVLTGGEIPAMVIVDSVARLIPGVLGGESSADIESFSEGNQLEYPQYTRPVEYKGAKVPEVLLGGNHAEIAKWRRKHVRNKL